MHKQVEIQDLGIPTGDPVQPGSPLPGWACLARVFCCFSSVSFIKVSQQSTLTVFVRNICTSTKFGLKSNVFILRFQWGSSGGGEISAIWWASVPLVNCCYKNSILRRFSGRGAGGGTLKAPDGGQANRLTTQK